MEHLLNRNRVEASITELVREQKYKEAQKRVEVFESHRSLSSRELESLMYFKAYLAKILGDEDEALYSSEGYQFFPDSERIRLLFADSLDKKGEVVEMMDVLTAKLKRPNPSYVLQAVQYAYLWSRYDSAMSLLSPLLRTYENLRVMDKKFLQSNGLPPFEIAAHTVVALSYLSSRWEWIEETINKARGYEDLDINTIQKTYNAWRENNFQHLHRDLQLKYRFVNETIQDRLRSAVLESRLRPPSEGRALLESITLPREASSDITHVKLCAIGETYAREGDREKELDISHTLIAKAPQLIPSWDALNFFVLDYQEEIKKRYQEKRRGD